MSHTYYDAHDDDHHHDHDDYDDDDDIVEDEDEQVVESGNARRRGSITHTHSQNQHRLPSPYHCCHGGDIIIIMISLTKMIILHFGWI